MRILVVEDDPAVSQSIALMLRSDAGSADMTDLGQDAIELARWGNGPASRLGPLGFVGGPSK